jgi:hypothetical protein
MFNKLNNDSFSEGFEIVIVTHDDETRYDYDKGGHQPEYLLELESALSEIGISKSQIEYGNAISGVGAELGALLLIVTGFATLFLGGKKIEENIEAWIKLAKRLKNVIKKLRKREGESYEAPLYVSEPFALALAIGIVIEANLTVHKIELEASTMNVVWKPLIDPQFESSFQNNQMRYYIFTFRVHNASESIQVICLRSTGDVEFHHIVPRIEDAECYHSFTVSDWNEFEGLKSEG